MSNSGEEQTLHLDFHCICSTASLPWQFKNNFLFKGFVGKSDLKYLFPLSLQVLSSSDATSTIAVLSPGGALMQGGTQQAINRKDLGCLILYCTLLHYTAVLGLLFHLPLRIYYSDKGDYQTCSWSNTVLQQQKKSNNPATPWVKLVTPLLRQVHERKFYSASDEGCT